MGCGEGSMLREVAHFFRNEKIKVRLIGMDLNEQAIAMGRERSKSYPEISFMQQDILQLTEEDLTCDILLCTLTMHHFRCEQIPQFLEQFVKLSTIGVVINDLQRSRLAYYLFKGFSAIFIRTKIAKHDGLISVRSGFTKKELIAFSKKLPQVKHSIRWKWAFRYVWMMQHH